MQDPQHPATELVLQSHGSRGWCTPARCGYPQELTLRLAHPAALTQIQLLSHESKVHFIA